jgi:acetyl esterase/lipase
MEHIAAPPRIGPEAPIADILDLFAGFEEQGLAQSEDAALLSAVQGLSRRTEVITGIDFNSINLHIVEPIERKGALPCVVHFHGGGMTFFTAEDAPFVRWRDELASMGMVVVGVEFRNAAGKLGNYPFPAGLNDCASAARWAYQSQDALGISHIILSGESGGGNLCIATGLKALKENWVDEIAGVYAMCPYIAGKSNPPLPELVSWRENAGYMMTEELNTLCAIAYDPSDENRCNPLAWPYHATLQDIIGLPPHVVSVNELDPLRDEGLIFARKLMAAGVTTLSRTVNGTGHGFDALNPLVLPNVYYATIGDIYRFATTL